jgi:hypothetical protein
MAQNNDGSPFDFSPGTRSPRYLPLSLPARRRDWYNGEEKALRKDLHMTIQRYRQGDILFSSLTALPEGLTPQPGNVIVEGEATSHSHCLVEGQVLTDAEGALFLEALRATQVVHPEHHAIDLPPGYYRVTRQREYTPETIRQVWD